MNNFEIANMYNNEGLNLKQIGEKLGISKSTVQRRLIAEGWKFDKVTGKYKKDMRFSFNKTAENELIENSDIVAFALEDGTDNFAEHGLVVEKKLKTSAKMVNRTYAISEKIDRAIRIKSAIEGKKPIDIIREALEAYIEDKYLNM